jgi:hypothetical protein
MFNGMFGGSGNNSSPFKGRANNNWQYTPPPSQGAPVSSNAYITSTSSGQFTGAGGSVTAHSGSGFVSVGGYQPVGGSTYGHVSAGVSTSFSTAPGPKPPTGKK